MGLSKTLCPLHDSAWPPGQAQGLVSTSVKAGLTPAVNHNTHHGGQRRRRGHRLTLHQGFPARCQQTFPDPSTTGPVIKTVPSCALPAGYLSQPKIYGCLCDYSFTISPTNWELYYEGRTSLLFYPDFPAIARPLAQGICRMK